MAAHDSVTRTLLVLDDEPDILDAIARLFRKDCRVLTAQSVTQAQDIIARETVHVVLADQRLPKSSGIAFLTELRQTHPDVVRVLFTGYTNLDDVIASINAGNIYRYIAKPWKPAELKLFIQQAFEHYEAGQERTLLLAQLQEANAQLCDQNTQLAEANAQLQNLDDVRRVFMEVVSHELNTPMTIIMGYTHVLSRQLGEDLPDVATRALDRIESSAQRLQRISDRIFQMVSTDAPTNDLTLDSFDLRDLAVSLHEHVAPFLQLRHQELLSNIEAQLGHIEADRDKLLDALLHLTMNAIKFSHDGQKISLSARSHPDLPAHVLLTLEDHGIGISEDDLAQIFDAFFSTFKTGHHSSGDYEFNKRGIGLGLPIARKFIEMHHGSISVTSLPDQGTTFSITLPLRQLTAD